MSIGPTGAGGSRLILRKLREIMAGGGDAQLRLDKTVTMIGATMVADVCSIYLTRGTVHELFATEGLRPDAVHRTRLKAGEGLVGLVAESARPLNLADAPHHPRFSYRPETGEDPFNAFLGVPILRSDRVFGVLVVQNRVARVYAEEEVEALQTIAMVLAEMVAGGGFGDLSALGEVEARPSRPERLIGRAFSDGLVIGQAVLHAPHAPLGRIIADDPAAETLRLQSALARVRAAIADMVDGDAGRLSGASREVLETFQMLANDPGWEAKLLAGIKGGLSADAAVERVRQEHRAKLNAAKDPYLRERLQDIEDLDNRLLRALAQPDAEVARVLRGDAILVARDLGPAELLEYPQGHLKGVVLEEGGPSSHAVIVARAMGLPMVGRLPGLLSRIEEGDVLVVDAEAGEAHLRPAPEVITAFRERVAVRSQKARAIAQLRDKPAVTLDGRTVHLLLNAGLALDLQHLTETGATGVGLFRTEFQFMVSETLPRASAQVLLYREVLDLAGDRPVTFRTLDLGGDKVLPYMSTVREENPALGWRALRIGLDRPALLRYQLRGLIAAAEGQDLRVMFPLVAVPEEFLAARALVDRELDWAKARGRAGPKSLAVGAMLEAPALAFAIEDLKGKVDFLSIGSNDLMQYFYAADRGNARVAERYDILSPAALRFLSRIREAAALASIPVTVCGEAAGRPLEAAALLALGYDQLSMPGGGVGPVKRMLRSLNTADAAAVLADLMASGKPSLRQDFANWAHNAGVQL